MDFSRGCWKKMFYIFKRLPFNPKYIVAFENMVLKRVVKTYSNYVKGAHHNKSYVKTKKQRLP